VIREESSFPLERMVRFSEMSDSQMTVGILRLSSSVIILNLEAQLEN
jgi:hypothetical protein